MIIKKEFINENKSHKGEKYTPIPNELADKLSNDAIILYYHLFSNNTNYFKSIPQLQKKCGWAKQKWNRVVNEIKMSGYVNIHRSKGIKNGQFNYTIILDEEGNLPKQEKTKRTNKLKTENVSNEIKEAKEERLFN